ncbi:MAG: hybrid sensor histidine kinase/response regulator [Anaeromyxobacteraceae bacterium]
MTPAAADGPLTLSVLVVDDEPGMRLGAARVLAGFRCAPPEAEGREVALRVEAVETGEAALERIRAERPDLVLLDERLPGLSGLEVLARLAAEAPEVLTVMVTAYATLGAAVAATKRGAFDFLAKPFTPDELRATVEKAVRHALLLRQARRHADERRRIRFEFVSVLAHELKAPLSAVEGNLLDMEAGVFGPDLASYRASVARGVERLRGMRRLVADLLDLTAIESGERRRALVTLEVGAVAAAILDGFSRAAGEAGVALRLAPADPVWAEVDRRELELVLTNLVDNAIKYNRRGGRVEVAVAPVDGRVRVVVEDTGIGIAPEEAAGLFKEFVRVRTAETRHLPGSGLGLATVRKVAQLYGGDATLRSEPGAGTRVEVELGPVAAGPRGS